MKLVSRLYKMLGRNPGYYVLTIVVAFGILIGSAATVSNHFISVKKSKTAKSTASVLGTSTATDTFRLSVNAFRSATNTTTTPVIQRLTVNVTISNTSNQPILLSPLLQMHVEDQNGKTYNMTAEYAQDKIIGGPLNAGSIVTSDIDFNLPDLSQAKVFIFALNDTTESLRINLK